MRELHFGEDGVAADGPRATVTVQRCVVPADGNFPGNSDLPLLVYKAALSKEEREPVKVARRLHQNGWEEPWFDVVYDYHHYHECE